MSERIFGAVLLALSLGGLYIASALQAPVSYEPVGPRAFPMLVLSLLGIASIALILSRKSETRWAPPPVLGRVLALFGIVLAYALLFDRLGFVLSTTLAVIPLARLFGGSYRQALPGAIGLGIGFYILFDRLLDVALPTGLWLKPLLG